MRGDSSTRASGLGPSGWLPTCPRDYLAEYLDLAPLRATETSRRKPIESVQSLRFPKGVDHRERCIRALPLRSLRLHRTHGRKKPVGGKQERGGRGGRGGPAIFPFCLFGQGSYFVLFWTPTGSGKLRPAAAIIAENCARRWFDGRHLVGVSALAIVSACTHCCSISSSSINLCHRAPGTC